MTSLEGLGYAQDPLDRATELREDAAALAALRTRPDARVVVLARDMPVLLKGDFGLEPLLPLAEVEALGGARVEALLGVLPGGAPVFAALMPDDAVVEQADASDGFQDRRVLVVPGRDDLKMVDIRTLAAGGLVPAPEASMLAAAKALLAWHARRSFCANCGAKTNVGAAGWRRECPNCGMHHFPRTDPVVIMLAIDGDRCLLGPAAAVPQRHVFGAGRLPGAGRDDRGGGAAGDHGGGRNRLRRGALFRLTAVAVSVLADDRLLRARRKPRRSRSITTELEDARWFPRDEVRAMLEKRHPNRLAAPIPMAIAHHLVKAWAAA